jgi:nucleotide-binding universal stress UspA family protein
MENLKILIPTDFSVQAEYAYLMVKKLGERASVDIHFLHVLNVPDTVTMDGKGSVQTCGEIEVNYVVRQKEIAERKLEALKTEYGSGIQTHLVLGKVTDGILSFAENNQFDLIVMGTKGAWGMKEKLSGSETQIIARKSQIPVLSLMCDRSDLNIHHVLLVHNFQLPIKENLIFLKKLIYAFNPKIHLLQIVSGYSAMEQDALKENMKLFAELNQLENLEYHLIEDKDVEQGVVHFNQMSQMDMVCIGTHGKGGFFHQSATEKLINHLYKPIISFHLN